MVSVNAPRVNLLARLVKRDRTLLLFRYSPGSDPRHLSG